MCAYNKVNGTYASEHRWLLTEVLREQWGFEGLVVSDWGAVHDRVAALAAGLDLEMPPNLGVSDTAIVAAVKAGDLPETLLDHSAARVLRLVQLSKPALAERGDFNEAEHHAIARRAARECAVLLKNDNEALPLHLTAGATVAVIGEFARTPRYQGAGSSQVNSTILDTPLDELRAGVGDTVTVSFAQGFVLDSTTAIADLTAQAVELATAADHVLLFLGLPSSAESEGFDRDHLDLPANQLELLDAVTAVHDRVIVVLANGSVVRLSTWDHKVAAILECWLSGQAAGGAAADLILGVANPSGKLAETIPVRLEDNPSYLNFPGDPGHVRYGEGIFIGYRAYDRLGQEVSYPFGYGLSYTSFEITDVAVTVHGSVAGGDLTATITTRLTNTGDVGGAEVVQVYVGDPQSTVARPPRELKAFTKVFLDAGETRSVTMTVDQRAFSFWSERHRSWVVEAGDFEISVGSSSRDLPETVTIHLDAPSIVSPLGADSTLAEWFADDKARAVFAAANGESPLLRDAELVTVIGSMPMATLAAFGMGFDRRDLDALIQRLHQPALTEG
jgi:beta-glucosidase